MSTTPLLEEIEGLLKRLADYNPPDRTHENQRRISQDIYDAADALRRARDRIAELEQDGERLDWLCSKVYSFQVGLDGPIIDANREAIDQARRADGGGKDE